MARLFSSGFELQSATAGVEFEVVNGTPTISTTTFRSGLAAGRFSAASTNFATSLAAPGAYHWVARGYFRIATASDALTTIMNIADASTSTTGCRLRMNSNRTLELWSGAAQVGSDSAALDLNTWYRLELEFDDTVADNTVTAYIDGTSFASGTGVNHATVDTVAWGVFSGPTTVDVYFDDLAVNDFSGGSQNTVPGAGSIVHMQPDGAGDNADQSAGTSADIDEITPDDATTIITLDADADLADFTCESSSNAGISSTDTISVIQVGVREAPLTAAADSYALRIKSASGGTTTEGTTLTHNDTTFKTNGDALPRVYSLTSYTDPTTAVAWTPTGTNSLDNMQIGVHAIDATPDIRVSTLWALVEYVPTGGGGGGAVVPVPTLTLMGAG